MKKAIVPAAILVAAIILIGVTVLVTVNVTGNKPLPAHRTGPASPSPFLGPESSAATVETERGSQHVASRASAPAAKRRHATAVPNGFTPEVTPPQAD